MHMIAMLMKRMYWFQEALQSALEVNGLRPISRAQASVIGNIAAGQCKASNIARNLGVSRQAISQILTELERLRYIEFAVDPNDKRSRIVRFNDAYAEEGETCARILDAIELELGQRIGRRRTGCLRESLEAEWGEPPRLGRLPELSDREDRPRMDAEVSLG